MVRYQGDDPLLMMIDKFRLLALFFVVLVMSMFIVVRPTQGAQFTIAGWDPEDEYGQGIYGVTPYGNSTGSFLTIPNPDTGIGFCYPENTTVYPLNFTANTALQFDVRVTLNHTMLSLSHPSDLALGLNYIKVDLEMWLAGNRVFLLENMTYDGLSGLYASGIWFYSFEDIINVILVAGQIYTVVAIVEVYGVT